MVDHDRGRYHCGNKGAGIWNNKVTRAVDRGTEFGAGSWIGNGRGIG